MATRVAFVANRLYIYILLMFELSIGTCLTAVGPIVHSKRAIDVFDEPTRAPMDGNKVQLPPTEVVSFLTNPNTSHLHLQTVAKS